MTDRFKGVWVAFEQDMRDDEAQPIIDAIRCLRGVADVQGNVANSDDWINRVRVRDELGKKLWNALRADDKK